jgi:broad specificity phosphatase PhoE
VSVILLVRHGQASFGAADYDQLSPTGEEQSAILGRALAARGVRPTRIVAGAMKRHAQTANFATEAAGWGLPLEIDAGWDEFDHLQMLAVHTPPETDEASSEKAAFQRWFEEASAKWTGGQHDDEYDEPFGTFTGRVDAALARLGASLAPADTAVVFTSGGPVSWAATSLLDGDAGLWLKLNPVTVNTAVTKIVIGRRGMTLVSLNDHAHLEPDWLTYR